MQRSIMDMAPMISTAIRHAIDHHGKTEVVALLRGTVLVTSLRLHPARRR
ncbi:hypothetical protein BSY239_3311 [Hydrogenophaga sp. RAC07]|nr:hypothetical protein [Hydrogenophaga sp. RAC07]AOF84417.1 hypothetical protein BSY239_3311 [Hydrogenophaga sp. RAC07]